MESVCAYRKLLRAVKKHVTNDPNKSSFRNYISQEFRKRIDQNADKDTAKKNLQLAEDYASLLSSVHHHKELLFSYNIAINREEEQKERMRNTAERVGLRLPKLEYEEEK